MSLMRWSRKTLKTEQHAAWVELLESAGQVALGGAATIAFGWLSGTAIGANVSRPWLTIPLGATGLSFTYTALKARDLEGDIGHWSDLSGSKFRTDLTKESYDAQFKGYLRAVPTQQMKWMDLAIRAGQTGRQPQPATAIAELEPPKPPALFGGDMLADPFRSTLVVGQPGAGKGLLVAHGLRAVKQFCPDCQIWAIPVKNDSSEANRWNPADHVFQPRFSVDMSQAERQQWAMSCHEFIKEFAAHDGPKLLVFDECLGIREALPKWFKGFVQDASYIAATGRSTRQCVWLLSQTPNATDFGMTGGARNVFRRVLVASGKDLGLLANRTTFTGKFTQETLDWALAPTGRLVYDSAANQWAALANLPEITEPAIERGDQAQQYRAHLENLWAQEMPEPDLAKEPSQDRPLVDRAGEAEVLLDSLLGYLQVKGQVGLGTIVETWGIQFDLSLEEVEQFLGELCRRGQATRQADGKFRATFG